MTAVFDNQQHLYQTLRVNPSPLLEITAQHQLQEIIASALGLRLFGELAAPATAAELASRAGLDERVLYYVLKALVFAGCLDEQEGCFRNTALADTYLREDSYLYLGHEFGTRFAEGSMGARLAAALRGQAEIRTAEPGWTTERLRQIGVFGLMGSLQSTLNACDLGDARTVLDLGGGHGFYSIALAQQYPQMKVTLFDLPSIVVLAEHFIREFAVAEQVEAVGGNFLTGGIGSGYDAVLCANILHGDKRDIVLPKVWQALNKNGRIILKCRVDDVPDTLNTILDKLRWQIYGGRVLHTAADWQELLLRHGFGDIRVLAVAGIYATITARKQEAAD